MQHLRVYLEVFGGLNWVSLRGFFGFFASDIWADFYRAACNADAV